MVSNRGLNFLSFASFSGIGENADRTFQDFFTLSSAFDNRWNKYCVSKDLYASMFTLKMHLVYGNDVASNRIKHMCVAYMIY